MPDTPSTTDLSFIRPAPSPVEHATQALITLLGNPAVQAALAAYANAHHNPDAPEQEKTRRTPEALQNRLRYASQNSFAPAFTSLLDHDLTVVEEILRAQALDTPALNEKAAAFTDNARAVRRQIRTVNESQGAFAAF